MLNSVSEQKRSSYFSLEERKNKGASAIVECGGFLALIAFVFSVFALLSLVPAGIISYTEAGFCFGGSGALGLFTILNVIQSKKKF